MTQVHIYGVLDHSEETGKIEEYLIVTVDNTVAFILAPIDNRPRHRSVAGLPVEDPFDDQWIRVGDTFESVDQVRAFAKDRVAFPQNICEIETL